LDFAPKHWKTKMEHHKKYKIIYADPAWVYQDKANAGNGGSEE